MNCTNTNLALACFNGTTVLVHTIDDGNGKPQVRFINANGDIVAGATVANTTLGACQLVPAYENVFGGGVNIAEGAFVADYDPIGMGPSWTWSPSAGQYLQSFTVTALQAGTPASGNAVRVRFGATGSEIRLVKGQTFTWSVAQDYSNISEVVDQDFEVVCLGDSAANIVWTEQ